jgi:hypothetical protein
MQITTDITLPDGMPSWRRTRRDGLSRLTLARRVFEKAFGHETVYPAAMDGGEVAGVLPLAIFRSHRSAGSPSRCRS